MSELSAASKLDCWGMVEIFGHTRLAGHLVEEERLGTVMLRVDVPDANGDILFTRYFGHGAIFSLNPLSRELAIRMAQRIDAQPVKAYELPAPRPIEAESPYPNDPDHDRDPREPDVEEWP